MKRYFLVHDDNMPTVKEFGTMGVFKWIDLESHGAAGYNWNVLCFHDEHVPPKGTWFKFPSILDTKTTLAEALLPNQFLVDLGLTGKETALEAIVRFGEIDPMMGV